MKIFDELTCSTDRYAPLPRVGIPINCQRRHWIGAVLLLCSLELSACGGSSDPQADTEATCVIGTSTIGTCEI